MGDHQAGGALRGQSVSSIRCIGGPITGGGTQLLCATRFERGGGELRKRECGATALRTAIVRTTVLFVCCVSAIMQVPNANMEWSGEWGRLLPSNIFFIREGQFRCAHAIHIGVPHLIPISGHSIPYSYLPHGILPLREQL